MGFVSGLQLNELFFREVVAPILVSAFPDLRYSAARIGPGSDVLGYDSERSTDHGWGPGLTLFLSHGEREKIGARISTELSARLPATFRGYSTAYADSPRQATRTREPAVQGRVNHGARIASVEEFLRATLDIDFDPVKTLEAVDWLLMRRTDLRAHLRGLFTVAQNRSNS